MSALVYFNGKLLLAQDARVAINDRAMLFGLGFFETFRTSGGRPHHWSFNLARLRRACAAAGLAVPEGFLARDEERLHEIVRQILATGGMSDAVFRYTLTGGAASGQPAELLTMRPLPAEPSAQGVELRVLRTLRDNGEWLPRPKSLNYANALMGANELARRSRTDSDEGLFLSRAGSFVVETTRQSVAWVVDGELRFPDPAIGPVEGTCLAWALATGLPARAVRASVSELLRADGVLVLNAVRGVTPVRAIWNEDDRVALGVFESHAHPLVVSLRQQWRESLAATANAESVFKSHHGLR